MNVEFRKALMKTVQDVMQMVRGVPLDLLDQEIATHDAMLAKMPPGMRDFTEESRTRLTLLRQWCNQAREQLRPDAEVSKIAFEELLKMLREGGPL